MPYLRNRGYEIVYRSFFDRRAWIVLYARGRKLAKVLGVIKGFVARFFHLFDAVSAEFVLIHREATPFGPPIFEWIIARILEKKIIYDFDDAIYLGDEQRNPLKNFFKMPAKVGLICKWAYAVTPGNEILAHYASRFNPRTPVVPTVISDKYLQFERISKDETSKVIIGWTGSHSTLRYLHTLYPVLKKLEEVHFVEIRVIANRDPCLPLRSYRFIPWRKLTEVEDLAKFDIGLMPLENNEWTMGKCGFKAIQYLSLGIPAVVSPIGANLNIVKDGITGFHAREPDEWSDRISRLIADSKMRKAMGEKGREFIQENYSKCMLITRLNGLFA